MKALILTPTPTHPDNAGNRKGVLQLCTTFRELGYELHCVYFPFETYDHAAMENYFEGKLYVPDKNQIYSNKPRAAYYKKRIKEKIIRKGSKFFLKKNETDPESLRYNSFIDEHIPVYLLNWFKININPGEFDLVLCEYVWMSKFLEYFPSSTFKIIDAHDVFSDRYKIFKKLSVKPGWVSLFPSEEAKGLKRANLLIAVNDEERKYFKNISGVECVQFGYSPALNPLPVHEFNYRLLYFASSNDLNRMSLNWFVNEIFPRIIQEQPNVKLLIGGRICSVFQSADPHIEIKGEFHNPADFYKLGDVVINPESTGTGLKIKAIETFAYGLPLVATTAGAMGADKPFMNHVAIANTAEEFTTAIVDLFQSDLKRRELIENAIKWLQVYKQRLRAGLVAKLPLPQTTISTT